MYIIFVPKYKKKFLLFGILLALWVSMFSLAGFIMHNSFIFSVTINNYLSFSYPFAFQVDDIYINEQLGKTDIETNSSLRRPIAQEFSSYKSLNGKFSFNYPSVFALNQQSFPGSDILYHIDFHDKSKLDHGFVQVWNLPYSLSEFLEQSKSTSQQSYKYFNSKPVSVNGNSGYLWDYSVLGNDGNYYKGSEVFFKKDNKMYRISYFVPEMSWNKAQSDTFWNIVNSFKTF